jgi:hypothetical protein
MLSCTLQDNNKKMIYGWKKNKRKKNSKTEQQLQL